VARLAPRVRGTVSVALPGVNPAPHARIPGQPREYLHSLGVRPPFILYVGAVNAQKDVRTLTAAHMVLQKEEADLQLVVAGRQTWPYDHGAVRDHPSVVRLAEVSDELLGALYSQCHVFVQPSRYEGFGLTALEAMSFGVPVVVSDGGALPEVVGPAGSTYPAGDAVALTGVLRSLMSHPAERALAAQRSCDRAAQFSWEAMATGVIEALTKAANTFSERT
jgi:glycosyltransferase involved in cell wall biosynthesis